MRPLVVEVALSFIYCFMIGADLIGLPTTASCGGASAYPSAPILSRPCRHPFAPKVSLGVRNTSLARETTQCLAHTTVVQGEMFVSFALKPGCQARVISICFPLQQPGVALILVALISASQTSFFPSYKVHWLARSSSFSFPPLFSPGSRVPHFFCLQCPTTHIQN